MSEEYQDFPPVSQELINALEQRFPDKMTDLTDLNVICHLQGQVSVVRLLKHEPRRRTTFNLPCKATSIHKHMLSGW